MRLVEHFAEFRSRILLIVAGLVVGSAAGWFLFDPVFAALSAPIVELQQAGRLAVLNFSTIASAFDMRIRVSLFIALIITSPWWIYQVWAFVGPGLHPGEKRYVAGFLGAAIPLFLLGASLGWLLMPHAVELFLSITPTDGANLIDANTYLNFTMRLVLAFGVAFLFPVVMVILNLMGVVSAAGLLRGWRWAVVLIFTFAAFANPLPDPWSMIALGIVMVAMFFIAVGIAAIVDRRRSRREAEISA